MIKKKIEEEKERKEKKEAKLIGFLHDVQLKYMKECVINAYSCKYKLVK